MLQYRNGGLSLLMVALLALPLTAQGIPEAAPPAINTTLPPDGTPLVFVNTQAILPVAPGADSAEVAFRGVIDGFQAELEGMAAAIDSMTTAYRQQEGLMDPAGRAQRQDEIASRQQAFQTRQQEMELESERRQAELLAPILQHITDVIEGIRAEHGYSIVFDVAESGVVAADTNLDITGAVLLQLGIDPNDLVGPPSP